MLLVMCIYKRFTRKEQLLTTDDHNRIKDVAVKKNHDGCS